jgi:hypothetical protein
MDDSFNYPLSLLEARLKALAAEAGNFTTISGRLLDILANETSLIDDILAADELARWEASLPRLSGAWSTGWSFRIGQGKKSFTLAPTDPVTGVEYASDLRLGQVFDCTSATLRNGLLPPATPRDFPFKSVSWTRSLPSRAHNTPRARAGEGQGSPGIGSGIFSSARSVAKYPVRDQATTSRKTGRQSCSSHQAEKTISGSEIAMKITSAEGNSSQKIYFGGRICAMDFRA